MIISRTSKHSENLEHLENPEHLENLINRSR